MKGDGNMQLAWITFVWIILMIIYFGWKWFKEKKEQRAKFKARMRNYDQPLSMDIGKRIKYKGRYRK